MRRSFKITLILVILAGIYFALPFSFGIFAQRSILNFVRNQNQTLSKVFGVQLSLNQYHRGCFSSTAVLYIEKKNASGNVDILQSIPLVIKHGPFYRFNQEYSTGFGMISSKNIPIVNSPYEMTLRENVGFNGEHGALILFTQKTNNAKTDNMSVKSLILLINSNLQANQFLFRLEGQRLHFQDPQQLISADVGDLQSTLQANYVGDRHWDLTLSIDLGKNQISAVLPNNASSTITLHANQINLKGVHFDTQKMAGILKEVIELKQATDAQKPVKPTAWMALFQQLLTEIIQNDTRVGIQGLSLTSPMGQLQANYSVSFPTLLTNHDYFDVATRNVGDLQIIVPHWTYTDTQSNTAFVLNNFQYNDNDNTVFSRHSKMTFATFDINKTQAEAKTLLMNAAGFSYEGNLSGDTKDLSQTMDWQLNNLCFSNDCFKQIEGKLELLKMNFDAFRGIADATRKVVQYNPQQSEPVSERWMNLANAYAKLVTPDTQVVLEHDMITPEGAMKLHGEISWPAFAAASENAQASVAPITVDTILNQAVYRLNMLFPAAYVDTFLNQQAKDALAVPSITKNSAEKKQPEFEAQVTQFLQYSIAQGYLKKVGDTYVLDLTGNGNSITINGVPWKAQS